MRLRRTSGLADDDSSAEHAASRAEERGVSSAPYRRLVFLPHYYLGCPDLPPEILGAAHRFSAPTPGLLLAVRLASLAGPV